MSIEQSEQLKHLELAVAVSGVEVPGIVLPESGQVVLHGMRFHYLDWGGNGPPILFLHGGGLTAHTWDVVCLALRDEYRCLALDQRGHGDSEWSPQMDYSTESHVGDIEAFADSLGLKNLLLVGMSMGGINSIVYASRHSDRLAGLVLVDVGPNARPAGARRIGEFMAMPAELDSVDEFVERALSFNPKRDPRLLRRSLLHNLRQLPDGKWTWKYDRRHRLRVDVRAIAKRNQRLWKNIPLIKCPTLVVRGGLSDVFLDEDARELAETLEDGRWVRVEGAGHTVQGDNPRGLLTALREFFDEIGA